MRSGEDNLKTLLMSVNVPTTIQSLSAQKILYQRKVGSLNLVAPRNERWDPGPHCSPSHGGSPAVGVDLAKHKHREPSILHVAQAFGITGEGI